MFSSSGKQLTIFINETDHYHHQPLYLAIVQMFKREGYSGVTVVRGVACFGATNVIYSSAIVIAPKDLPVMVSVVDRPERIETAIASLKEMAPHSLMTVQTVGIVQSRISTISGGR